MIGLIRVIIHTTNIINNLKERQTGIPVEKRRNVSPILAVGMLLNGLAIAIQESVSGNVKIAVQILAIILCSWDYGIFSAKIINKAYFFFPKG